MKNVIKPEIMLDQPHARTGSDFSCHMDYDRGFFNFMDNHGIDAPGATPSGHTIMNGDHNLVIGGLAWR